MISGMVEFFASDVNREGESQWNVLQLACLVLECCRYGNAGRWRLSSAANDPYSGR
jgi:hypothetical protein